MSTKRNTSKTSTGRKEFIARTVTLPKDIADFADRQKSLPQHAGNLSSYIRSLILRHHAEESKQAA